MTAPTEKLFVSAESLLRDSLELGRQIVLSGYRPSFLVGIWRGGAPIGIVVQEVLEYNGIECDHIARIATVYFKPARNRSSLKPDFHVRTTDNWLVFPHELQGLTRAEILAHKPVDESFFRKP